MNSDKMVRLGLSGCGSFAVTIANAVKRSRKAEIVTCFDVSSDAMAKFNKNYGFSREASFDDLVNREDIDGVLIIAPNAVHAEQAVSAARNGKNVFVEKPIANTIPDARRMIAACEKAGVTLMVGHYRRRNSGIRKIKNLLSEGVIGKPVAVEACMSNYVGFELTPDKFRWRGDDTGCPAGPLMTMGIHHVDVFNYLLGPIEKVSSFQKKLYIPADVVDVTTTICEFESGILGYLGANYTSPKANWMYIYGTNANILWSILVPDLSFDGYLKAMANQDRYTRVRLFEKKKDRVEMPLDSADPFLEEIDEFADCIKTGKHPETDGTGALVALTFIRAAIESAKEGRPVSLKSLIPGET